MRSNAWFGSATSFRPCSCGDDRFFLSDVFYVFFSSKLFAYYYPIPAISISLRFSGLGLAGTMTEGPAAAAAARPAAAAAAEAATTKRSNSDGHNMAIGESQLANTRWWQVLVKVNNLKTHVVHVPSPPSPNSADVILASLSAATFLPARHLRISTPPSSPLWSDAVPYLSAVFHLPLRGGKGGFGTLLKGQSKQAGAKTTVDFGACRDLSGRRLRHINDEVKLRKWRDAQARRERGLPVDEVQELRTESGIRGWHLMVPSWADGAASSNKAMKKADRELKREVERWMSAEEREKKKREEARERQKMAVAEYVRVGDAAASLEEVSKKDKVLEIMKKKSQSQSRSRKRERLEEVNDDDDEGNGVQSKRAATTGGVLPAGASVASVHVGEKISTFDEDDNEEDITASYLCTLSGDVMVDQVNKGNGKKKILQSQSEFATAAVLLSLCGPLTSDIKGLYYEAKIRSGGLAQIGWAYAGVGQQELGPRVFRPNSDTGDGVGDDDASFGYDGYRGVCFHAGEEKKALTTDAWKDGDIVGCSYDVSRRLVSYTLNGKNIGVAFEVGGISKNAGDDPPILVPAFSLNQGEVVEINVGPNFDRPPTESGFTGFSDLIDDTGEDTSKAKASDLSASDQAATAFTEPVKAHQTFGTAHVMMMPPIVAPRSADSKSEALLDAKKTPQERVEAKDVDDVNEGAHEKKAKEETPFDLNSCQSLPEVKDLGMDRLKDILSSMGCKCGGSLDERAERLFSLRGLSRNDFPKKVRGKNFVV